MAPLRILRGKSNLEVSSKGFAWFVVGLVLASFIGGAVRTILSSNQVHSRIVSELRGRFPHHQFEIGQTEVLLSRGFWPGLGLRIRNLTFRQDVCGKLSFLLEVPEAVLPIDLLSLRKGKVRLGHVELTNGKIHFDYRPCEDEGRVASDLESGNPAPKKPMISTGSLDWRKVNDHLDAIELTDFTLTYERNATWKILIHRMRLDLSDDLSAHGLLDVQKSLPFGALSHIVDLEAQGDENVLQWGVHSEFKEGLINLKGSLDFNNGAAMVQANARQLPLKDVMSELFQMGLVERDVVLKTTWLSCGVKWEGPLSKPSEAPLVAKDCKIEGGYGRVDLDNAEFWMDAKVPLKTAAKVRVTKLQVQPMLEALGRQVLPAVLARPGVWTGTLSYLNPVSWDLDGHLENVEVVFSHRSVRGKQLLEKLRTRVQKIGNKIEAKMDELIIHGGDFKGLLQFNLQDDWRNGQFVAAVEKLRFSPNIQNLLVGGTLGNLKLSGQGGLQAGELAHWDGQFELDEVSGAGWRSEGINIRSRFTPGVFHLDGRVTKIVVGPDWSSYAQVKRVYPQAAGDVRWRDLSAKVDIQSNSGLISSAVAIFEGQPAIPWKLKGNWVRDGQFNAVLSVSRLKNFSLRGENGVLSVQENLGSAN